LICFWNQDSTAPRRFNPGPEFSESHRSIFEQMGSHDQFIEVATVRTENLICVPRFLQFPTKSY